MPKYVDNKELEAVWGSWLKEPNPIDWEHLSLMIYRISEGVATHFNPKDEDEHVEHTHDALTAILHKIKEGKLKFTPGKAPVFNLLTTTAFHILYSKMNKQNRVRRQMERYRENGAAGGGTAHKRNSDQLPVCREVAQLGTSHYKYTGDFCQYLTHNLKHVKGLQTQTEGGQKPRAKPAAAPRERRRKAPVAEIHQPLSET
ncbi:MAG: hypothetical protein Q8K86_07270 [Candidatus Nanopelagicaceae bacterium]|nr:hypothetical protein [Candidatus Nanopelagicaceae bacterium]